VEHPDDHDRSSEQPRSRRDEWEDRHEYEPRRYRYRDERDDYDEEFGGRDPRQKLQAPGTALMIVGWLGVLLGVGGAAVMVALIASMPPPPAGAMRNDDIFVMALLIAVGLITVVASALIAIGGARMRQCRSYGLAMTAAILAICSIVVLGLMSIVVLPFGIWALVVLVQPDVKREFDRARLTAPRQSEQEWE
jgi:hypothetical protein